MIDTILTNNSTNKINVDNLLEKVSVKNIEYYKVDGPIFQKILHNLLRKNHLWTYWKRLVDLGLLFTSGTHKSFHVPYRP